MNDYPKPLFPKQQQSIPGVTGLMYPVPDHGRTTCRGSAELAGKRAVITGADSGMGRAVALAFTRDDADVLLSYLDEHHDATEARRLVVDAGRKTILPPSDIQQAGHGRRVIDQAVVQLGNNAAQHASLQEIGEISDEESALTSRVNVHAIFHLTKAAVPQMRPGSSIINTTSVNADEPNPSLLAHATAKGATQNFTASLAPLLATKRIQVNAVAPDPIWTPLIPSTLPDDSVMHFGNRAPKQRPGQPAELAKTCVMLADPLSSYVSDATIAVTGGMPIP